MSYKLKRGQPLVLRGPQGSGKTTLARQIAEQHGHFVETNAFALETEQPLIEALASAPETVIIDGFPQSERVMDTLKGMIASETISIDQKNAGLKAVKTPNFIFCTGSADPIPLDVLGSRRFMVVDLPSTAN